jgi:hypothetical protein
VQIQASGQRIEYFNKVQLDCGIKTPLKIPLQNNTRWGSSYKMLAQAYKLQKAINLFLATADQLFGPITVICQNGHIVKTIPWSAFNLSDSDWELISDACAILKVSVLTFISDSI